MPRNRVALLSLEASRLAIDGLSLYLGLRFDSPRGLSTPGADDRFIVLRQPGHVPPVRDIRIFALGAPVWRRKCDSHAHRQACRLSRDDRLTSPKHRKHVHQTLEAIRNR